MNDLLLCSRFLVKSLSVFILFFLHCGTQAFSSCVSRGFSRVAVHRLLVVVQFCPRGDHGLVGSLVRTGLVVSWRELKCCGPGEGSGGHFLLENRRRVFPVKKVLPERRGDWRPLTLFQKWPWMRSSWWEAQPSSEGPLGYLGHLRSSSCLCH